MLNLWHPKIQDELYEKLDDTWIKEKEANITEGYIDVLAMKKNYNCKEIRAFEVKGTKADLMSDLSSGKWMKYLPYCSTFYFVYPRGVVTKDVFPDGVGLITVNEEYKMRTIRRAVYREIDPSKENIVYRSFLFRMPEDDTLRKLRWLKEIVKTKGECLHIGRSISYKNKRQEDRKVKLDKMSDEVHGRRAEVDRLVNRLCKLVEVDQYRALEKTEDRIEALERLKRDSVSLLDLNGMLKEVKQKLSEIERHVRSKSCV